MSAVDRRRVEEICHGALERDAAERAAFLREACGADVALQTEVEALLAHAQTAEHFLAQPVGAVAADVMSPDRASLAGRRIGVFEIVSALGAGGMGEVYRARDTELGRDVAIKVLPPAFVADRERLARFEREARVLAALNHPNIAAIYGVERIDDGRALILELVEGETLDQKLRDGAGLPMSEALGMARQIAEALEAAHEKGIVHRDLKPANIKITPDGTAKVLDFGIATVVGHGVSRAGGGTAEAVPYDPHLSQSPTVTIDGTGTGVLLGTAAYMSPEQARGQAVDKRADIWAFGCVLYEMLTGRVAFDGSTVADRTAAILGRDPDWSALPGATPFAVQRLLRRCLEKDPKRRLHDIADARLDIDEALSPATHSVSTATRASRRQWNISAWAAAGLLVIGIAAVLVMNRARQESPLGTARMPTRFVVQPPPHVVLDGPLVLRTFDVSPDGSLLVFEATEGGVRRLYLRRLDQFGATPIGGTEGARQPFFSHDGRFVGFWANQQIKRVGVTAAAAPVVVCDAKTLTLANWGDDDTIVFRGGIAGSMQRVPADGGAPRAIMTPDTSHGEIDQHDPRLLPGSKAVMFTSHRDQNRFRIEALVLATGERKPIVDPGFDARYLPSGHLVYSDGRSLLAVPFDLDRLEVKAAPVKLVDDVVMELRNGIATYSLSAAGTLVYQADADRSGRTLVWVDRSGNETAIPVSPRAFIAPRVSPDGKRIAFGTADRERRDIWVYDLAGDTLNRLTREHDNQTPIWTPDGQRVAYTSIRNGLQHLVWQPADGSAPAESLVSGPNDLEAAAWTPDGRALLYVDTPPTDNSEILVLPAEGERKARRFLYGSTSNRHPSLSPDGRWATFTAWESGRGEIYVDAFPGLGSRHQVTVDGGHESKWSRDGRQLFYRSGDAMFAAPVDAARSFSAGKPVLLFRRRYVADPVFGLDYDAAPDGRFLMIKPSEEELRPPQLNVVVNWIHEVTRRVPLR